METGIAAGNPVILLSQLQSYVRRPSKRQILSAPHGNRGTPNMDIHPPPWRVQRLMKPFHTCNNSTRRKELNFPQGT